METASDCGAFHQLAALRFGKAALIRGRRFRLASTTSQSVLQAPDFNLGFIFVARCDYAKM